MDNTTPYQEVSEAEATAAGLPEQPDTTYREQDGHTFAYNAGTRTFWKLGESPFGAEPRRGAVGRAVSKAQDALEQALEAEGGKVLCCLMIVHAAGVSPDGAIDAAADDDEGPSTPQELVDFALAGVAQLAARYGMPFSVMDVGQG